MMSRFILLGILVMSRSLICAAADQESSEIAAQLHECIKHGNWIALHVNKNQLTKIKGEHLESLLYCLEYHRRALEVAEELLDIEVCHHVQQMRDLISERVDAEYAKIGAIQSMSKNFETSESESESDSSSYSDDDKNNDNDDAATEDHRSFLGHYDQDIAAAFIMDEREKQENLWFWQRDNNRDRALHVLDASRNMPISEHVRHIRSKTRTLAHSVARAHISFEQYHTDEAIAMMQTVMNRTWKKECWEDENGVMGVGYVRRDSGEQSTALDNQEELQGIPCAIL